MIQSKDVQGRGEGAAMPSDQARAKQIFLEALDRQGADRSAYLRAACDGQQDLRHRVEALLLAHDAAGAFMANPSVEVDPKVDDTLAPETGTMADVRDIAGVGARIGPYKLLQMIGEGGFGVVYMAEQEHPVRRKVALKIIKLGMDTKQVIARFEAERQALAMMEHPNIAQVLDAGATERGRPYFVMELVRGVPITEYCDNNSLDTHERLDLFRQVCRAVHHAHQKGIIHRDLKPGNVLVTLHDGKPVPKIIDFGIAKATSARLTEKTLFTEFRQFIGTPQYMSPEQAEMSGLDVDTRSDIYSLGVLLYELLTGTTPFDPRRLRSAGFGEIQRMIREDTPPRPSTRLSTIGDALQQVATRRRTDPQRLSRALQGDLDWIIMKALEKDRTRRYDSASTLALEVDRFLKHEPVDAGPPSPVYRARKFVERHRAPVIAAVVLALVMLGSAIGMSALAAVALQQQARAVRESAISAQINAFLNEDLLGQADPLSQPDPEVSLRTVIDRAADRIENRFESEPLVEAAIRSTLGTTYQGLGEFQEAAKHLEQAVQLTASVRADTHFDTLQARRRLAQLYWRASRYDEAEAIAVPLVEAMVEHLGSDDPETIEGKDILSAVWKSQGKYERAEPLVFEVLEHHQRVHGEDHPGTLTAWHSVAGLYKHVGRYDESVEIYEQVLAARRRILGEEHPHTLICMSNLALSMQLAGQLEETEPLCRQVLAIRRRVFGEEHPQTLVALNNLGYLYSRLERWADARPHYEAALAIRRQRFGEDHPDTLLSMNNLGHLYTMLGDYERAEPMLLSMLERTRRVMGDRHPDVFYSLKTVGNLYERSGRLEEAERAYFEMVNGFQAEMPPDHPIIGISLTAYGRCLVRLDRLDEAEATLDRAEAQLRECVGPDHPRYAECVEARGQLDAARAGD